MKTINIGLIGSGFMGKAHSDAFTRVGRLYPELGIKANLFMLAETSKPLAKEQAAKLGFTHFTDDWRELVTHPDVDIVDITTPNFLHYDMAMAAIEAGKHVYCEKPLTVTVHDAEKLVEAARKKGVSTMIAFNNVKTPSAMLAKSLIEEGAIGTPIRFRGAFDQGYFNDPMLPHSWRTSRTQAGSGALGDLGAHVISVAQYLLGDFARVIANAQTLITERPSAASGIGYAAKAEPGALEMQAVENEDQIQALVDFKSGASGVIEASRMTAGRVFGISWEVSGTEGTLYMDGERFNELRIAKLSEPKEERGFKTLLAGSQIPQYKAFFGFEYGGGNLGYYDVKVIEVHDLLAAIDRGAPCFPDFAFGLHNQRVMAAMEQTLSSGTWEEV